MSYTLHPAMVTVNQPDGRVQHFDVIEAGRGGGGAAGKIQIDYIDGQFKYGDTVLNFLDIYNLLKVSPSFVYLLYGDRAYLCSYLNDDGSIHQIWFESVLNADNVTKTSSIYLESFDGVTIGSVTVRDINSENIGNKTQVLNDNAVNYPSTHAVKTYVDTQNAKQQHQIDNLIEAAKGKLYSVLEDDDEAYSKAIPDNALPGASLDMIGGRSVVRNQMCKTDEAYGLNGTVSHVGDDLKYTVSAMHPAARVEFMTTLTEEHRYLHRKTILSPHQTTTNASNLTSNAGLVTVPANRSTTIQSIVTATAAMSEAARYRIYLTTDGLDDPFSVGDTITISNLALIDLTQWFGAEIADTITTPEEAYALGVPREYIPYDSGTIVSANVESVDVAGRNLIEEMEIGMINSNNGIDTVNSSYSRSGYIPVDFAKYVKYITSGFSGAFNFVVAYNRNKEMIARTGAGLVPQRVLIPGSFNNTVKEVDDKTIRYVRISYYTPNFADYPLSLTAGETEYPYSPYHPPVIKPIPDAIRALPGYGWGIGDIYNEVDFEAEKYIQRVGALDLGEIQWVYESIYPRFKSQLTIDMNMSGSEDNSAILANRLLCAEVPVVVPGAINNYDKAMFGYKDSHVYVRYTDVTSTDAFKQAVSGVMLYYELATPIVTDISNLIPDGFADLTVETGGSVTFKQSELELPVPNKETYLIKLPSPETSGGETDV